VKVAAYVAEHAVRVGRLVVVSDSWTPPRIRRALNRRYGAAVTLGGGEQGYWIVDLELPADVDAEVGR
jgi:hypothetical protein